AVSIDTTGVVEGYTADETRGFFLGNPDKIIYDAYEAAKTVQNKSKQLLVEGNYPIDIYNQLQELVRELGFGDNFMGLRDDVVPFIGHGVGLELDEFPIITPGYKDKLIAGQLIAMEPKFILDNPKTGIGIEDTWIVGKTSAEKITNFEW
ncbi:MAG: M24 family metallopeptidase, partial [Candidatus Heimdallarchaeota archaeon]|nr:M24 family metallopeptidase [Candidatus Heimdallarchaeota archaeon]